MYKYKVCAAEEATRQWLDAGVDLHHSVRVCGEANERGNDCYNTLNSLWSLLIDAQYMYGLNTFPKNLSYNGGQVYSFQRIALLWP